MRTLFKSGAALELSMALARDNQELKETLAFVDTILIAETGLKFTW